MEEIMSDEIVTEVCNLYFESLNANDLEGVTKTTKEALISAWNWQKSKNNDK